MAPVAHTGKLARFGASRAMATSVPRFPTLGLPLKSAGAVNSRQSARENCYFAAQSARKRGVAAWF